MLSWKQSRWFNMWFCFVLFFNKFIYFIFGCVASSLLHAGFLQLQGVGATGAWSSHCGGFSCCGARALGAWASVVVACRLSSCGLQALECRLSSCGAQDQLLHGMCDLPGPGLKHMSPALAGGFLTTAPPGKPQYVVLNVLFPVKLVIFGMNICFHVRSI